MAEEAYRMAIFFLNVASITKFNSETHSYKQAVNQFSDLAHTEFITLNIGVQ